MIGFYSFQAEELLMSEIDRLITAYENYAEVFPVILLDSSLENGTSVSYYPPFNDMMFCVKKIIEEVQFDTLRRTIYYYSLRALNRISGLNLDGPQCTAIPWPSSILSTERYDLSPV